MFDPTLLRSFLAVTQTRSFTQAAVRLGLQQSTVSQHVRRLEDETGRRLFVRDTHSVAPTADGGAMIEFAQSILEANERAQRYFAGSELRGRLRFGTSEDFVLSLQRDNLDNLDENGASIRMRRGGRVVWRDRLIWVAGNGYRVDPSVPVPLILYPAPSITREIALAALERAKRPWRIACVSGSLSGLRAASLAGLGVTTIAHGLLPAGLTELQGLHDLPDLGDIEFVLQGRAGRGPAAKLADAILASGNRLQSSWEGMNGAAA